MKRALLALALVTICSGARAQMVNDLVALWLAQHGIAAAPGDYTTAQPDGGADAIQTWNSTKLGPQPTPAELAGLAPSWQARQQAKQYGALIDGGIVVTSATSPAIDATYACDEATQNRLAAIVVGISAGQGLPGGGATFLHPDIAGAPHAFTADQITALAKATRDFIYNATITRGQLLSGHAASWPTNQLVLP